MAEQYGVKPRKFTKEWWPYYWMYYKWQTVAGAVAGIMILVTAVQCATREKYDVNITYAGSQYMSAENVDALEVEIEKYVEDFDGNGEKNVFVQALQLSNLPETAEMDYAMMTKHDLELAAGDAFVFIYDKAKAEQMLSRDDSADVYEPVENWCELEITGDECMKNAGGIYGAISLKDSSAFKDAGVDSSELYIAVKAVYADKDGEGEKQKNAIKLVNELLK